jgi:hypothetical protein
MSTLSKSTANPVASIKSVIQSAYVSWSIDTGSTDWYAFIEARAADLAAPMRLALGTMHMASPSTFALITHTDGLMTLLVQFDIISGHEKALRDRLTLIQQTRENELALAAENNKVGNLFLSQETRLRLGRNVDTSVSILTAELEDIKHQFGVDSAAAKIALVRIAEIEDDPIFIGADEDALKQDEDGYMVPLFREYLTLQRKVGDISRRKSSAITRTLELTTQLQMSVGTLEQLSGFLTGLVDATFNYANPEDTIDGELTETAPQPYITTNVGDSGYAGETLGQQRELGGDADEDPADGSTAGA